MTIGGNDLGFAELVKACAYGIGECPGWLLADNQQPVLASSQANDQGATSWDVLFNRLVGEYVEIGKRIATQADIYILSYPTPFSNPDSWNTYIPYNCNGMTVEEAGAANRFLNRLDDTIFRAVSEAGRRLASGGRSGVLVHFVDWRSGETIQVGSLGNESIPVNSNGLCAQPGAQVWLNGLIAGYPNMFHPTLTGYNVAAGRLIAATGIQVDIGPVIPYERDCPQFG